MRCVAATNGSRDPTVSSVMTMEDLMLPRPPIPTAFARRIPPAFPRWLLSCLLIAPLLASAVPLGTAISYQGELRDGGTPASGLYDIRACLHDSLSGGAPLVCAPILDDVPVDNGLFTTAFDFGALPFDGEERWLELQVPGSGGDYQPLTPRQLLRVVPEAMRARSAASADWSGLTGVPAGFADGIDDVGAGISSITAGTGLSGGTITSSGTIAIAPRGVGSQQLAISAVDSGHVMDGSLLADDIFPDALDAEVIGPNAIGASELADGAVDSAALQDMAVIGSKLAANAVGAAQIDDEQVQRRVQAACPGGSAMRLIASDGSVQCEPLQASNPADTAWGPLRQTLDLTFPYFPDITFNGNGLPVIAVQRAGGSTPMDLISCSDRRCAQWQHLPFVDSFAGNLLLMDTATGGIPVVLYVRGGFLTLRMLSCLSPDCRSGSILSPDLTTGSSSGIGLATAPDGMPSFSYRNGQGRLEFRRCTHPGCLTAEPARTLTTNVVAEGPHSSLVYSTAGNPVIAYQAFQTSVIVVVMCNDPDCASAVVRQLPGYRLNGPRLLLSDRSSEFLLAAHRVPQAGTGSGLVLLRCPLSASCDSATLDEQLIDVGAGVTASQITLARGDDGVLVMAYRRQSADGTELRLARCSNRRCSQSTHTAIDVVAEQPGREMRMALGPNGLPFVVQVDERPADDGALSLLACNTRSCQ